MEKAYSQGLPRWDDVQALFEKYSELGDHDPSAAELADQQKAYSMIKAIRDFVRYHFVVNAVYADNTVQGGRYQTLSSDEMGVAKEVRISGGGGQLTVTDASGHSVTVNAADTQHTVNKMTRDYWFNTAKTSATTIETSSFCAVHEISEPLCRNTDGSFQ